MLTLLLLLVAALALGYFLGARGRSSGGSNKKAASKSKNGEKK